MKQIALVIKILILFFGIIKLLQSSSNDSQHQRVETNITENPSRSCMVKTIQTRSMLKAIYNKRSKQTSISNAIESYTSELEKLPPEVCPMAFKLAYKKYVSSWKELIPITDEYSDLRGTMTEVLNQLEESADSTDFRSKMSIVKANWKTLQTIATFEDL